MLNNILDWFAFGSPQAKAAHDHGGAHGHTHGVMDATIATTTRGIWAIKWSFVILAVTATAQSPVVRMSGSVTLLAAPLHHVREAGRAPPLVAARRPGAAHPA